MDYFDKLNSHFYYYPNYNRVLIPMFMKSKICLLITFK